MVMLLCLLLEFIFKQLLMKKIIYLFLLIGLTAFSQNQNSNSILNSSKPKTFNFTLNNSSLTSSINYNLVYLQLKNDSKNNALTIYNSNSSWNDSYILVGNNYYLSNSKSSTKNNWLDSKIDSLNPSGTTNFKGAVVLGVLNLLLE